MKLEKLSQMKIYSASFLLFWDFIDVYMYQINAVVIVFAICYNRCIG